MDGHRRDPPVNAFYVEGGRLSKEDEMHARRVLRLSPGDRIVAMDGEGGRFLAELKEGGAVELLEPLPSNEPPVALTVYQGVPKADKLEFLAQKLTELGVMRLVPVSMERSVKKIERVDRLRKIAREAAKQCGRGMPMAISEPLPWRDALADMKKRSLLIAPWEEATEGRLLGLPRANDIGLLIGPEGGMSAKEIQESGARTVTLGPRILRTETAAVAAAAVLMAAMGDL
ncbi:MAG: 16S rRNA (uracil(1498)-N(3))-methyltransferase [Clostridiales bacterium]|nr:16S rRNA (uracil(1498)-N(3))-methyltransferase [Clostridiales bacterium]